MNDAPQSEPADQCQLASAQQAAHANPLHSLGHARLTGSKADRKAARRLVHNAARKIQSAARARLASLGAEEEARFQSDLEQALRESLRESVGALTSVSTNPTTAQRETRRSAQPPSVSCTAAAAASATSSTTVAPSTAAASATAAVRTSTSAPTPTAAALVPVAVTSTTARTPATSTALTHVASPAHEMLPQGTYLQPCIMGATIGPWGQHVLLWDMVSQQPTSHNHGEPRRLNAQNEPINSRGKTYVPPPPPGPRGCNGGSHRSFVKRAKEKAKRQHKRAATGQQPLGPALAAAAPATAPQPLTATSYIDAALACARQIHGQR